MKRYQRQMNCGRRCSTLRQRILRVDADAVMPILAEAICGGGRTPMRADEVNNSLGRLSEND